MARHEARTICLRTTLLLTPHGSTPSVRRSGARSESPSLEPPPTGWKRPTARSSGRSHPRAGSRWHARALKPGRVATPRRCVSRAGSPPGSGRSSPRVRSSPSSPAGPREPRPINGASPQTRPRPDPPPGAAAWSHAREGRIGLRRVSRHGPWAVRGFLVRARGRAAARRARRAAPAPPAAAGRTSRSGARRAGRRPRRGARPRGGAGARRARPTAQRR